MVTPAELLDTIRSERLMPIIRCNRPGLALPIARQLIEGGYGVLEVSLTTPDALTVIQTLAVESPEVRVGAGTVLAPAQVSAVRDAGGGFIVTPALSPSIAAAIDAGLPVLAGALTPSEIVAALDQGATAVKLFPAELGGVGYFGALRAPFPDVPLIPVGGVTVETGREYLSRGALGLGLGSPLTGGITSEAHLSELAERAGEFRRMAAAFS